jgi:hypothetical protein
MGISVATYYKWCQKFVGLGPSELKKLPQLEDENSKLKHIAANLSMHYVLNAIGFTTKRQSSSRLQLAVKNSLILTKSPMPTSTMYARQRFTIMNTRSCNAQS